MGVNLKDLLIHKKIGLEDLPNKVLVIDAYNHLYQYLTTIRARDGSPLMDSKGQITSHLVGLFSRTTNLMQKGMKLAFVFDGEPPKLKRAERARRKELKEEAEKKYEEAKKAGATEEMKKYAARFARLTTPLVDEAKKLVSNLGLPVIQAPSEGDAQTAFMVKNKDAYACVSQDFDSLLHGASRVVRNLSIAGRKKKPGTISYEHIQPELILLKENLKHLKINQDQLIVIAILIGTDYDPGGAKGIGPKNALKLVKGHKDFDKLFEEVTWEFDYEWRAVFDLIKNMPVTKNYELKWKKPDKEKTIKLLCDMHDFSYERVEKTMSELLKYESSKKQQSLGKFM